MAFSPITPPANLTSLNTNLFYDYASANILNQGVMVWTPPQQNDPFNYGYSTNSGCAGNLAGPTGVISFNQVRFNLHTWKLANGTYVIPTRIRVVLKQTNQNGAVLATITRALPKQTIDTSVYNSTGGIFPVVVDLPSVITSDPNNVWMEVYSNGYCCLENSGSTATYNVGYTVQNATYYATANTMTISTSSPPYLGIYAQLYLTPLLTITENTPVVTTGTAFLTSVYQAHNTWYAQGWAVGNNFPSFNSMMIELQWGNAYVAPPTECRIIIRDCGATLPTSMSQCLTGAVLGDVTVPLDPTSFVLNSYIPVQAFFNSQISTSHYLYVEIIANSAVGVNISHNYVAYGGNNYYYGTTNNILTEPTNGPNNASGVGLWYALFNYNTNNFVSVPVPGNNPVTQYNASANAVNFADYDTVYSSIPHNLYAVSGHEFNIYFKNLIRTGLDISNYQFFVICNTAPYTALGYQYNDRWTCTPTDGQAGTYPISIQIWKNGTLLTTLNSNMVVTASTAGGGATRQIVTAGDSTHAGGQVTAQWVYYDSTDTHLTLTPVGAISATTINSTGASATIKTDSVAGWSVMTQNTNIASSFLANSSATISSGGTQGTNTATLSSVSGIIVGCFVTLTGGTTESLYVTGISGNVVTFSANIANTGHTNAYWFDFAAYATANGLTFNSGDYFYIPMGINDVGASSVYTTDALAMGAVATMMVGIQAQINSVLAAQSGMRIVIALPLAQPDQNIAGSFTGGPLVIWRTARNIELLREAMNTMFINNSSVDILPLGFNFDTVHNYPFTITGWNKWAQMNSVVLTPGSIAAGATYSSPQFFAPNTPIGSPIYIGAPQGLDAGLIPFARASSPDYITLTITNTASGALTPPAGATWNFWTPTTQAYALGNDGVHPYYTGYWQNADSEYAYFKAKA